VKWEEQKLGNIAKITMGMSPKGFTYNNNYEGLPLLNGPTEFGEIYPNCTLFTTDSKKKCETGDLIFCVRGSTGRMNWADRPYSLGRGVCAISGKTEIETKYIRYCLDYRLNNLLQLSSGTTFTNLTKDTIRDFKIPYHPRRERIASILSAYDDLIENNLRRIELLEKSARLLYDEWFVRLRFPGFEGVRVVDGVPEGWERKEIEKICKTIGGGTPSTKRNEYWESGTITWIVPTDITKNNCLVLLDSEKKITEEGLKKSSAKMLPPETILMTSRASVGYFGLIDKEACTNQGFISIIPNEEIHRMYICNCSETLDKAVAVW
jgi:type I restriction enzyme S subunit